MNSDISVGVANVKSKIQVDRYSAKSEQGVSFAFINLISTFEGPVLATVKLEKSIEWKLTSSKLKNYQPGIFDLYLVAKNSASMEIDWVSFE